MCSFEYTFHRCQLGHQFAGIRDSHGKLAPDQFADEVDQRIAQIESGAVALIPGDEALVRVRKLLGEHVAANV